MNSREHHELFRFLMQQHCLFERDIMYVESVADWCRDNGIDEPDAEKPLRLVLGEDSGCRLIVREELPEGVVEERIKALRIRGTMLNVAFDRTESLDTDRKKLACLFLCEYARTIPDINGDELLADNWAFESMSALGFFKDSAAAA